MRRTLTLTAFALTLCGAFVVGPPANANAATLACDEGLCIESGGGSFVADAKATSKQRRSRSKKNSGTLSLTIEDGRGSVFINGRYAGTAPLSSVSVPAGKNDIQVRDGAEVLTAGVLTMPKQGDIVASVG